MRSLTPLLLAGILLLGHGARASAATPVPRVAGDAPAARNCVGDDGTEARVAGGTAGETEGAPPKFSTAFYALTFTLQVSMDGVSGRELPVSVEDVCDIPKRRAREAAQLAGADGVALLLSSTSVRLGGQTLRGPLAAAALDGADTATLTVRLLRPRLWREDEDGSPVPTFSARRVDVTD